MSQIFADPSAEAEAHRASISDEEESTRNDWFVWGRVGAKARDETARLCSPWKGRRTYGRGGEEACRGRLRVVGALVAVVSTEGFAVVSMVSY